MSKSTTASDIRQSIRAKIIPFGGHPPNEIAFEVGWSSVPLTFEQIMGQLRPQIVRDLLYLKRIKREYIGELVQQGWFRLWQALHEDKLLLSNLTVVKASDFVTNRTGSAKFNHNLKKYDRYDTLSRWNDPNNTDLYEDNITEIVIGSSVKSSRHRGRHALFTLVCDRLIDIESAMREVAEWAMDDIRKLSALYYVTTSVSQTDAGRIAGFEVFTTKRGTLRCGNMIYWSKIVRKKLKEVFASYQPLEPNLKAWREELKAGKTDPVVYLANKYEGEPMKLYALYILTTQVARDTFVEECGLNASKVWYAMRCIRQELRYLYARRVPA